MKILVTGADGFVGSCLVSRLAEDGHEVVGAVRPIPDDCSRSLPTAVRRAALELTDTDSVHDLVAEGWDAVVHLAAVASGADALRQPVQAWRVNAVGTARLAHELGTLRQTGSDPLFLLASTAEVYGAGAAHPRVENDPVVPCSPYAASKLAGEIAALEVHRRTGLRTVVARAFPHTGPGQDVRFVVPAFAQRITIARKLEAPVVKVGRLDAVRDFLHVSDVVDAYARLLTAGVPGEVYNVASGRSLSVHDLFAHLSKLVAYFPIAELDQKLVRPLDIPYLVGDSSKLRGVTGWEPRVSLVQTLQEVLDAQAN